MGIYFVTTQSWFPCSQAKRSGIIQPKPTGGRGLNDTWSFPQPRINHNFPLAIRLPGSARHRPPSHRKTLLSPPSLPISLFSVLCVLMLCMFNLDPLSRPGSPVSLHLAQNQPESQLKQILISAHVPDLPAAAPVLLMSCNPTNCASNVMTYVYQSAVSRDIFSSNT